MSKSPSLRRIQADVRELALDPSDRYHAAPLEDDMFEWHFTIRGAEGTDFAGGIYHGRILLPPEYPFKPPHIIFMTPSGRFETGTKVCLSFSAYHPELWQPAWGIRLILEALISFLPTPADGAIGALDWTPAERKRLAQKSVSFCCPRCGKTAALIPEKKADSGTAKPRFEKEIEQLRLLQAVNDAKKPADGDGKKDEQEETAPLVEEAEAPTPSAATQEAQPSTTTTAATQETEQPPASVQEPDTPRDADAAVTETETTNETAETETSNAAPRQQEAEAEPNVPAPAAPLANYGIDLSWATDGVLNAIIVVFSVICYLLYHKAIDLYTELHSLDGKY